MQDNETPPLAFLSHASEDKQLFAEPLGQELARLGIKPWLDKWEIRPGDSLVQKLFDEGIGQADAVIVVVSQHSVAKPWVREELDNAAVRRITSGTRLIPVRLDDVEMPAPLAHLVWTTAKRTTESTRQTARSIADTIFGVDFRPAVGPPPTYVNSPSLVAGLSRADAFVLSEIIREAMKLEHLAPLDWKAIRERVEAAGLRGDALMESLHVLAEADYIDVTFHGSDVYMCDLTRLGYLAGVSAVVPDVDDVYRRVIAVLVNNPPTSTRIIHELAKVANTEVLVVDQMLRKLEDQDKLKVLRTFGADRLHRVSPTLRRLLD